ncbi:MAG: 2-oxoacid:ferredoxin oxidoreductase subunit beta [Verrucomicrobiae bacterium]|nr:2-oxoacid:ferredoxin oxidoreductase subunit beta [Verrucomicrobiae bacterium]
MSAAPTPASAPTTTKDFKHRIHPDWCPGCGDFSVLAALQTALGELNLAPHHVAVVSGIGCSSNLPGYINCYGMHTLHGRPLPVSAGLRLANHEVTVIAVGGDGDGYGIGSAHFLHTARRNINLTYIVMDNQIYGLTTGQTSPTSVKGMKTKSTPFGNVESPIMPVPLAIVAGATYVARGYSAKQKHLVSLIKGAIQHKGFALVDVFSPCVTFNKDNTYVWFNKRIKMLEDLGHDPTDFHAAMERGYQWGDEIPIGLFWKRDDLPSLEESEPILAEGGPLAYREVRVPPAKAEAIRKSLL